MSDETNDNDDDGGGGRSPWLTPGAQGQAALLLIESLLHSLIEKGVLSTADAVAAVEIARDVKIELADEDNEAWRTKRASLALLSSIAMSLQSDLA